MTDEVLERFTVTLPSGTVEVSAALGAPRDAWCVAAMTHGAGSRFDSPFLVGFAARLREIGVATLRFNLPYAEAGRRMPGPAAHAIAGWAGAMSFLDARAEGTPVWAMGRSYGGRMASMAAAEGAIAPDGLVYLGYPLHAPGKPESPRVAHLPSIAAPQLFVSGRTDPFVDPHDQLEDAVAACPNAELMWVDGNHSYEVKGHKRPADVLGSDLAPLIADWIRRRP